MGAARAYRFLLLAGALGGCAPTLAPAFEPALEFGLPEPDAVEAVVILVGDAGAAGDGTSPLLADLAARVEHWGDRLEGDSAVTVAFLGDNVYPLGVRDRGHRKFPEDSVRLWSQIATLDGPVARAGGAQGLFLPGNHDWGESTDEAGLVRLLNQSEMLAAARGDGTPVRMAPEAVGPGPDVVDVGSALRLISIDTQWYLQSRDDVARGALLGRVGDAMADGGDRHIVILAHHPFQSAGPHGLLMQKGKALGIPYLMRKSGSLIQDRNAAPYRDLLSRLRTLFRDVGRPPLAIAGGHDHSLQVLDPEGPDEPRTILVSGAGSKITEVAESDLLRYASSTPGYMMLVLRRTGAVDLFVLAAASRAPLCPPTPESERVACMASDPVALDVVYSERLARSSPPSPGGFRPLPD